MHKNIQEDIKENLNMDCEITRNMAMCFTEDYYSGNTFPNSKRLSDIILLVNKELLSLKKGVNEQEIFMVSLKEFNDLLNNLKVKYKDYFSKEILNLSDFKYLDLITTSMRKYAFINVVEDKVYVYPSITRFVAKVDKQDDDDVQLSMEVI